MKNQTGQLSQDLLAYINSGNLERDRLDSENASGFLFTLVKFLGEYISQNNGRTNVGEPDYIDRDVQTYMTEALCDVMNVFIGSKSKDRIADLTLVSNRNIRECHVCSERVLTNP